MLEIVSRARAGLPPRPETAALTGSSGLTVHWNGPPMGLPAGTSFGEVARKMRAVWRFHTYTRGWGDFAYNFAVSQDGQVFEGRGWGVRPAAQGYIGNGRMHAVIVLIGEGERPTDAALASLRLLDAEHTRRYGRSKLVPHSRWAVRTCPGPVLTRWLRAGYPAPKTSVPAVVPAAPADPLEAFMSELSPAEREVLESLAGYLAGKKVRGSSFGKQLLDFHREERPRLQALLRGIDTAGSTPFGLGRLGPAVVRAASARGWDLASYDENKVYPAPGGEG